MYFLLYNILGIQDLKPNETSSLFARDPFWVAMWIDVVVQLDPETLFFYDMVVNLG